jgi:hypothetical protein
MTIVKIIELVLLFGSLYLNYYLYTKLKSVQKLFTTGVSIATPTTSSTTETK